MKITLPATAWLFKRYGLMIGEQSVYFVSWSKGSFTKISEFVNDQQGLTEFNAFFKTNSNKYKNKFVGICVSVVGEDYRSEKVAHLVGKYKSDMLKRKYQQLFRGATYHLALAQGREPLGRRQDIFLFCGILSNEKVEPWVRELVKVGANLTSVQLGSLLSGGILNTVTKDKTGVNVVSVCSRDGVIRHTFYIDGQVKFSRQSKYLEHANVDDIYRSIRNEVEKTITYLTSVKLVTQSSKIKVSVVCSDDLVDSMNAVSDVAGADRINITAISARLVGLTLGIKKPIEEFGRDYSLYMHEMLRSVFYNQLAPIDRIRFYLMQTFTSLVTVGFVLWGILNLGSTTINALSIYGTFTVENTSLKSVIVRLKENYENQVEGFGTPPSSSINMRSAVNVLENASGVSGSQGPGKLLLYFSTLASKYPALSFEKIDWYVSNAKDSKTGNYSFANGKQTYEILEVQGKMNTEFDAKIAIGHYKSFVEDLNSRGDMEVIEDLIPSLIEAGGELVVTIEDRKDIKDELNKLHLDAVQFKLIWNPSFSVASN